MSDKDAVSADGVPLPTIPLNEAGLGDARIAENADELLGSFGADADRTER